MPRKPQLFAALASFCLLAVAVAAPRSQPVPVEEPVTCPYCGGRFTVESFGLELGARMTLRTVRILTGS